MKQKKWDINILDNPNLATILENDEFYTTDTEAFLVFELKDKNFNPTRATITLSNRTDGSVVNEDVPVASGVIEYEMRQEAIKHAGHWQAQLVYEQDKDGDPEKYTSKVVSFKVSGHLLDNKEPPLFLIENWNNFILSAESLIEDWENAEAERESAESRREETLQEVYLELDDIRATLSALDPNDTSGELQQIKDDIARIETNLANITPGNYDQEIQQINDELTTINNALSTYETPSGAQEKADTAETNAKAYADSILTDAGGGVSSWNDLMDKPSTFTPSAHTHAMTEVNGLQAALDGLETTDGAQAKATAAETNANDYTDEQISDLPDPSWDEITGKPLDLETTSGAQAKADAAELSAKNYADSVAVGGDTGPVTWGTVQDKPLVFPPDTHTHPIDQVTNLQTTLDSKETPAGAQSKADAAEQNAKTYADGLVQEPSSADWNEIINKPASYPAEAHNHSISEVTGLQTELDGKETLAGAEAKASAAETNAKNYADTQIDAIPETTWTSLSGKPSNYPPSAHNHSIDEVSELRTELNSKETPSGAQDKADAAETSANAYTDAQISENIDPEGQRGLLNDATGTLLKYWAGSQAEYDAIETYDLETVYDIW